MDYKETRIKLKEGIQKKYEEIESVWPSPERCPAGIAEIHDELVRREVFLMNQLWY